MYMYMYMYIYVFTYWYVYVCIYMRVYMYMYMVYVYGDFYFVLVNRLDPLPRRRQLFEIQIFKSIEMRRGTRAVARGAAFRSI